VEVGVVPGRHRLRGLVHLLANLPGVDVLRHLVLPSFG
jgi:hypothetical protein